MIELNAPVGGNDSKRLAPEGSHVARCYQIIDLGTMEQGGQFAGKKRKVQFLFELPLELAVFDDTKGAQPYYTRGMYTLSLHEKSSLRRDVESWLGKKMSDKEASKFNIFKLLGAPCMVNVIHTSKGDNVYANIASISPVPKGMVCPPQINPPLIYSPVAHDIDAFGKLPEFVREKIKQSDEFMAYMEREMEANYPTFSPPLDLSQKPKAIDVDDVFGNGTELPWD